MTRQWVSFTHDTGKRIVPDDFLVERQGQLVKTVDCHIHFALLYIVEGNITGCNQVQRNIRCAISQTTHELEQQR